MHLTRIQNPYGCSAAPAPFPNGGRMTAQMDMVRAVAFVELCKEWFGDGTAGIGGALTTSDVAVVKGTDALGRRRQDEFDAMWQRAGAIADAAHRAAYPPMTESQAEVLSTAAQSLGATNPMCSPKMAAYMEERGWWITYRDGLVRVMDSGRDALREFDRGQATDHTAPVTSWIERERELKLELQRVERAAQERDKATMNGEPVLITAEQRDVLLTVIRSAGQELTCTSFAGELMNSHGWLTCMPDGSYEVSPAGLRQIEALWPEMLKDAQTAVTKVEQPPMNTEQRDVLLAVIRNPAVEPECSNQTGSELQARGWLACRKNGSFRVTPAGKLAIERLWPTHLAEAIAVQLGQE